MNRIPIATWKAHQSSVVSVQFSFDEVFLYSISIEGELKQWSVHHLENCVSQMQLSSFPTKLKPSIAYDNEVQFFAVNSDRNSVNIYQVIFLSFYLSSLSLSLFFFFFFFFCFHHGKCTTNAIFQQKDEEQ